MTIAITRTRADLKAPVPSVILGLAVQSLYAIIDVTTAAVANDEVEVGYLPRGCIPIGGYFSCVDMDTGVETLDMDLGIAANSAFGGSDVADPDFFMNGGLFSGDAITDFPFTNSANARLFTGPFPVTQLSAKTMVKMKTITAAATSGLGKFVVCILYLQPGFATT